MVGDKQTNSSVERLCPGDLAGGPIIDGDPIGPVFKAGVNDGDGTYTLASIGKNSPASVAFSAPDAILLADILRAQARNSAFRPC